MGTPGSSRAGRTLAYVSNSLRRVTLALFSPNPTGVSSGPLRTTRVRSIESRVAAGTPLVSPFLKTSAPASASSQSIRTPAASMILTAERTTSGPTPSPGMTVTRCELAVIGGSPGRAWHAGVRSDGTLARF